MDNNEKKKLNFDALKESGLKAGKWLKENSKVVAGKAKDYVVEKAPEVVNLVKETSSNASKYIAEKAPEVKNKVVTTTKKAVTSTTEAATKAKDTVVNALDKNGNGQIDSEDIIIMAMKLPGVRIDRETFLSKELSKNHTPEQVAEAIRTNPAIAGIDAKEIDKIADEVIKTERISVSGISTALGMPGGIAMAATLPADITQYYGYMMRAAQKLLYIYGWPELGEDDVELDSETINILVLCLGTMYGVVGAKNGLLVAAKALGTGVEKQLLKAALTKGTIYPIVKSISKWFGVKMTKTIFAGFLKKAIPVVGGLLGGGITFFSFKPCCDKLKASLQDTLLSNPNHDTSLDVIDVDYVESQINEELANDVDKLIESDTKVEDESIDNKDFE